MTRHITRTPLGLIIVTEEPPIIMGIPADNSNFDAEVQRLARDCISINHSLTNCGRCKQRMWIGPKQKEMSEQRECQLICGVCVARAYGHDYDAGRIPMVSLDPNADSVARRFT